MKLDTDFEVAEELMEALNSDTDLINKAEQTTYTMNLPSNNKMLSKKSFSEMSLEENLIKAIHEMGFESPSNIQATAIPAILEGKHTVVQSQSGTGKTISYVVPVLNRIIKNGKPQALVIVPSRCLSYQIGEIFKELGKSLEITTYVCSDDDKYESCEVIVGCPGKLINLIHARVFNPELIKMVVVDEADDCLDKLGSQMVRILKHFEKSTKIFFSATYTPLIKNMINKFAPDAITLYDENKKPNEIKLFHIEAKKNEKTSLLLELYEYLNISQLIVFANSKQKVDDLKTKFETDGHIVSCVHGGFTNAEINQKIAIFKAAEAKILIATDIFGRGMDIPQVNAVVNYDLPVYEAKVMYETYLHRIGRAGRFGRAGFVIDFVNGKEDFNALLDLQTKYNFISKKFTLHSLREVFYSANK